MFRWPQGETRCFESPHTQSQSLPVPTFVKLYPKHETNPDFNLYSKDKIPKLTLNLAVEEVSTGLKCHESMHLQHVTFSLAQKFKSPWRHVALTEQYIFPAGMFTHKVKVLHEILLR